MYNIYDANNGLLDNYVILILHTYRSTLLIFMYDSTVVMFIFIAISINFSLPLYTIDENAKLIMPTLLLSNPSSFRFAVQVNSINVTSFGKCIYIMKNCDYIKKMCRRKR